MDTVTVKTSGSALKEVLAASVTLRKKLDLQTNWDEGFNWRDDAKELNKEYEALLKINETIIQADANRQQLIEYNALEKGLEALEQTRVKNTKDARAAHLKLIKGWTQKAEQLKEQVDAEHLIRAARVKELERRRGVLQTLVVPDGGPTASDFAFLPAQGGSLKSTVELETKAHADALQALEEGYEGLTAEKFDTEALIVGGAITRLGHANTAVAKAVESEKFRRSLVAQQSRATAGKKVPGPSADEVGVLGATAGVKLSTAALAVETKLGLLDGAVSGTNKAFEDAATVVETALKDYETERTLLVRAVSDEKERRRLAVETLTSNSKLMLSKVKSDDDLGAQVATTTPTRKKFNQAKENHAKAFEALAGLGENATATDFEEALRTAGDALGQLEIFTTSVNRLFADRVKEADKKARLEEVARLRRKPKVPTDADTAVLAHPGCVAELKDAITVHDAALKEFERVYADAEPAPYEEARGVASKALNRLDSAAGKVLLAVRTEVERRKGSAETLRGKATESETADGVAGLTPGTPEAVEFEKAKETCRGLASMLRKGIETATPEEFLSAETAVLEQIKALDEVRGRSVKEMARRSKEVQTKQQSFRANAASVVGALKSAAGFAPADAALNAFRTLYKEGLAKITGKDEAADAKVVGDFLAVIATTEKLVRALGLIPRVKLAAVASNEVFKASLEGLTSRIAAKDGLSDATYNAAVTLRNDLDKFYASYQEIGDLPASYDDLRSNVYFVKNWDADLKPYLDLVANKDALDKGGLTIGIKAANAALDLVQARVDKKEAAGEADAEYKASDEWRIVGLIKGGASRGEVVAEMEALFDAGGVARGGALKRAYLTSHDDEADEEFSYEVALEIGGRRNVVIHAHCHGDGHAKGGNAAHFKLANNKRESGGTFPLSNKLRALLPSTASVLSERYGVWEKYRPSYIV